MFHGERHLTDYAFVVRKGDKYLADRVHQMTWTQTPIRARLFLTEEAVVRAAETHQGEPRTVQLMEID